MEDSIAKNLLLEKDCSTCGWRLYDSPVFYYCGNYWDSPDIPTYNEWTKYKYSAFEITRHLLKRGENMNVFETVRNF